MCVSGVEGGRQGGGEVSSRRPGGNLALVYPGGWAGRCQAGCVFCGADNLRTSPPAPRVWANAALRAQLGWGWGRLLRCQADPSGSLGKGQELQGGWEVGCVDACVTHGVCVAGCVCMLMCVPVSCVCRHVCGVWVCVVYCVCTYARSGPVLVIVCLALGSGLRGTARGDTRTLALMDSKSHRFPRTAAS